MEKIDEEMFTLDRTGDKRIAQLNIDRNVEIYTASKGKFLVVEWEHGYCDRLYFNTLSEAIQHCVELKKIYDRVKLKYSHAYGGVSM
tara:strand:+ start:213 stop:473 length:261 start_codon:yes stop_codon:yes gene_type:complete